MKALNRFGLLSLVLVAMALSATEAMACTSVEYRGEQSTIRFDFDRDYTCGQYANGDWWVVVDPSTQRVRITGISPAYSTGRNGWEINPSDARSQGLDSRIRYWNESNVPSLPRDIPANSSVLKTVSAAGTNPSLRFAAVLTIVGSAPANPGETFRPPYFGNQKPVYTTADIDWGRLPSLDCRSCTSALSLSQAASRVRHVQLDHLWEYHNREMHPLENMPSEYGADLARSWSEAIFRVMLNDPLTAKRQAVINIVQSGIDMSSVIPNGGGWPSNGGHNPGRKQLILFAGLLLNDAGMLNTVANPPLIGQQSTFQENGQIYRGQNGVPLWGHLIPNRGAQSWWQRHVSGSGDGASRDAHGYIDGPEVGTGAGYQWVTALPYKYSALIVRILGAEAQWNQDEFLEYADRWVRYGYHASPDPCAPYDGSGWENYGTRFGPPGGTEGASCIRGSGRRPEGHHTRADGGNRRSTFGDEMWNEFRTCAETCSCNGQACVAGTPVAPPVAPPTSPPIPDTPPAPVLLAYESQAAPTPTPDPTPTPPASSASTCRSIQSNTITFTFDTEYPCGQFVSGDWWVTPNSQGGSVQITGMDPTAYTSACNASGRNGWEINPDTDTTNALDSRTYTYDANLMPCLPYSARAGESLLKVTSANSCTVGDTDTCLDDAAILTILDNVPPATAFRPPFVGTNKPIFTTDQLDLSVLPNLPLVPNTPSIPSVEAMFNGPWIDHVSGWRGRMLHPGRTMRNRDLSPSDYGSEISRGITEAILRTMHQESDQEIMGLVTKITQFGIDLYYQLEAGQWWSANGGHTIGRKLPILYTGMLLNHQGMLAIGQNYQVRRGTSCTRYFSEDGQTYYGDNGVPLWGMARDDVCGCGGTYGGDPDYSGWLSGGCSTGHSFCRDPSGLVDGGNRQRGDSGRSCTALRSPQWQIDNNSWEASGYQWCCTSAPWIGTQIAALLLNLKDEWNYPAFFDYVDRWMRPPTNGAGAHDSPYFPAMYSAYRSCAPNCQ